MNSEPVHDAFMDSDMLAFWRRMEALPDDFRLYEGTALALYLNHRNSTDFDFVSPLRVVNLDSIETIPWIKGARLKGGLGMVEALVKSERRQLIITFMECGRLIPFPVREPIAASNGIAVAHPIDLMVAKIEACINRGEQRDYEDIASAFSAWPGWVNSAISALPSRSAGAIGRALASPPIEVEFELNAKTLRQLRNQARKLGYGERGVNP